MWEVVEKIKKILTKQNNVFFKHGSVNLGFKKWVSLIENKLNRNNSVSVSFSYHSLIN